MRDHVTMSDSDSVQMEDLKIGFAIQSSPIFKTYSNYTGTDAGYGFFSPNVGSEFIMSFAIFDCDDKLIGEHQSPTSLLQNESKARFNLCTYPMMERIMQDEPNEIYDKYFKVMLHQIAKNVKDTYENGHKVVSEIYMQRPATIKESLDGETQKLLLLERYIFEF